MTIRDELYLMVQHIPDADVPAAAQALRPFLDPVELSLLLAPLDDEPETEEERAAVELALSRDRATDIPLEELLLEYGL